MSDDTVVTKEVGEHVSRRRSLSRRDMIKRTAVAGAAVAWAVPVVEVLGSRAASASGVTSSVVVTFTFPATAPYYFNGTTITIAYVMNGTPESTVYLVSDNGVVEFQSSSTVKSDPFNLTANLLVPVPNSTELAAAQLSGTVPATDSVSSVEVTISGSQIKQSAQSVDPGVPFFIVAGQS